MSLSFGGEVTSEYINTGYRHYARSFRKYTEPFNCRGLSVLRNAEKDNPGNA